MVADVEEQLARLEAQLAEASQAAASAEATLQFANSTCGAEARSDEEHEEPRREYLSPEDLGERGKADKGASRSTGPGVPRTGGPQSEKGSAAHF